MTLTSPGCPLGPVIRGEAYAKLKELPGVKDVRTLGAIGVVEMEAAVDAGALCARFADEGVWIRPMGKVVYLTPAFVIGDEDLARLTGAVRKVLAP